MTFGSTHLAAGMTWRQVEQRLAAGAAAILPIGAGAKEHGLHLPMATDCIQAEWFASRIAEMIDAVIWPAMTYGFYPAFAAYAGSVSVSETTFENGIADIIRDLDRFGARTIIVLNTGLSTVPPIDRALENLTPIQATVMHLQIHSGAHYRQAVRDIAAQSYGSHADEMETSIMLALDPANVDMTRAQDSPPPAGRAGSGPLTPTDTTSANFSPSGSFGQPTLATAEKGRLFVMAILADLAQALASIPRFKP